MGNIKGLTPICFCGSPSHLDSNAKIYNGKEYGNGRIWLCDRYPECRGSVGVHPDNRPLGTMVDLETKKLRIQIHDLVDPLWQNQTDRPRNKARGSVYGWLARITGIENYHTAHLTKKQCLTTLEAIKHNPYENRPTPNTLLERSTK
jgi:hypothetical protein